MLPEPSNKWQLAHRAAKIWPPMLVAALPLDKEKAKKNKQNMRLGNLPIGMRLENPKTIKVLEILYESLN
jgi:hypothetical protein